MTNEKKSNGAPHKIGSRVHVNTGGKGYRATVIGHANDMALVMSDVTRRIGCWGPTQLIRLRDQSPNPDHLAAASYLRLYIKVK